MAFSAKIGEFFEYRRAYRELSRLDDSALRDLGVVRRDIKKIVYGR